MKRFFAAFLILTLLFPFVSCASESGGKGSEGEKEISLSEMSAEEFYAQGKEKNKALTSARYETKVFFGEEELYKIETVRIRSGYDGFSYSRSGDGYFCFAENTAFVENKHGKFQAPATSRSFDEYLSDYVFPLYGLDGEKIENLSRKENQIFYQSSEGTFLALYKELPLQGEFYPSELKGEANLSEEGIILSEKLTLTGKDGKGEDHLFRVETELLEYRSDKITVALPEKKEAFQVIQDIRIPEEMYAGNSALLSLDTFHSALVFSETVVLGEETYSLN
ncbi:MAG: hypothetical protein IKU24_00685, partial [Clostridia bacterium]|nr:hypothetical protein [Clostridia bacterium]